MDVVEMNEKMNCTFILDVVEMNEKMNCTFILAQLRKYNLNSLAPFFCLNFHVYGCGKQLALINPLSQRKHSPTHDSKEMKYVKFQEWMYFEII